MILPCLRNSNFSKAGKFDGEEVVQLYLSYAGIQNAPVRALKGFKRIHLEKAHLQMFPLR